MHVGCQVCAVKMVIDGQLWACANTDGDLAYRVEINIVVDGRVSQSMTERLHCVLGDFLLLLERLADLNRVVRAITEHEERARCRRIQLTLKGLRTALEPMKLDWAWILLALVKFFAHKLRKHLVNAQVCQE